jgi:hypothetical protein
MRNQDDPGKKKKPLPFGTGCLIASERSVAEYRSHSNPEVGR